MQSFQINLVLFSKTKIIRQINSIANKCQQGHRGTQTGRVLISRKPESECLLIGKDIYT